MNLPVHFPAVHCPRRLRWFMSALWLLIAVKCVVIWWASAHWHLPYHPLWVVAPTLVFAALVTVIWATHRAE